jgi:hypothetical protein
MIGARRKSARRRTQPIIGENPENFLKLIGLFLLNPTRAPAISKRLAACLAASRLAEEEARGGAG